VVVDLKLKSINLELVILSLKINNLFEKDFSKLTFSSHFNAYCKHYCNVK